MRFQFQLIAGLLLVCLFAHGRGVPPGITVHRAVNDPDLMLYLINRGADVNAVDKYGKVALMSASYDSAKILIDHGANVNATTPSGATVLHEVVDNPNLVELLLKSGAKLDALDNDGNSALFYVGYSKDKFKTTDLLLKAGLDIRLKNKYGKTSLSRYCHYPEYLEYYLTHGAQIEEAYACGFRDKFDSLQVVVKHGFDVDKDLYSGGRTMLTVVLLYRNFVFARWLVDHGANVDLISDNYSGLIKDVLGGRTNELEKRLLAKEDPEQIFSKDLPITALMVAVAMNRVPEARLLIKYGADPKKEVKISSYESIRMRNIAAYYSAAEITDFLVNLTPDYYFEVAPDLFSVAFSANNEIFVDEFFKQIPADLRLKLVSTNNQYSTLASAIAHRHFVMARQLIGLGARIDYRVLDAALDRAKEMIPDLIDAKGDFRHADRPLEKAAQDSDKDRALKNTQLLVANGVDVSRSGPLALFWAIRLENAPLAKFLVDSGVDIGSERSIAIFGAETPNAVQIAVSLGANINAKSDYGYTLLAGTSSEAVCQTLIDLRADLETRNNEGQTPLMRAVSKPKGDGWRREGCHYQTLLKAGAKANAKSNNGMSVLAYALSNPTPDPLMIERLKSAGAK